MSAGTANPTTCPRWRFPDAYGQAGATKILRVCLCSNKGQLPIDGNHDTSALPPNRARHQERDPEERDCDRAADQPPRHSIAAVSRLDEVFSASNASAAEMAHQGSDGDSAMRRPRAVRSLRVQVGALRRRPPGSLALCGCRDAMDAWLRSDRGPTRGAYL